MFEKMSAETILLLLVLLIAAHVLTARWIMQAFASERIDAPDDLEAREQMLDRVERSFYRRAGKALRSGRPQ